MIIFYDDWDLYPEAIVHEQTKNASFLRMAALYKDMGIKNHAWPLQLHNPELINVDPHDPNLSVEEIAMITVECKQNFFYYLREVARVPGSTPEYTIRVRANRGNMALYWLFFNHITTFLVQIRQTGKSFSVDELMIWLMNIGSEYCNINLLTLNEKLRSRNLARLKNIEFELPWYLKKRTRMDVANTEEMSVKALDNYYRGHLPNRSAKLADQVGRGLTAEIFHGDELAYLANIAITLPVALTAGSAARDMARMKDSHYGSIYTTTAGKKNTPEGKYAYNLLVNSSEWNEKFLDAKDPEHLEKLIRLSSPKRELRVAAVFNHRQLGYTDEWLHKAMEESEASEDDSTGGRDADFFNKWGSGSMTAPISDEEAERMHSGEIDPLYTEVTNQGYILKWYISENNVKSYLNTRSSILSLDTSDAAGDDPIAITLTDIKTGAVIMDAIVNEINLHPFQIWLGDFIVNHPRVTTIIERKSSGVSIIDFLLIYLPERGVNPYKRLYNKVVQEKREFPDRFKAIDKDIAYIDPNQPTRDKKLFGWITSGSGATARSGLYGKTMRSLIKTRAELIHSKTIINQFLSLEEINGRIDHPPGENDDLCVSLLLGQWLMISGENLHHYGIDSRDILSENKYHKQAIEQSTSYQATTNSYNLKELQTLVELVKDCRDPNMIAKLEHRIKYLSSQITDTERNHLSIDNVLRDLNEERSRIIASTKRNYRYY